MPPIIEINNLGKKYKLAAVQPYTALRDVVTSSVKNLFRTKRSGGTGEFWALRDISASVDAGERIGIIGRNGAGKSTLLKILSRIVPPTTGKAVIRGRIGSLLEVGTGFHPELTGRENIYLNGSILGLKKKEIDREFDAIIDFSGVERFLDTQLKHYSSGMHLRLAFSVAAHLNPEILLIDEVLAVGDLEFQKKCLGKMEEVSKQSGRAILFVSHNMDSIRKFCSRVLLLDEGRIVSEGDTAKVIDDYVTKHLQTQKEKTWEQGVYSPMKTVRLNRAFLHSESGALSSRFDTASRIGITMEYEVLEESAAFTHGLNVYNQENLHLFSSHDVESPLRLEKRRRGKYSATTWIPSQLLPEGIFSVSLALFQPSPLDVLIHEHGALSFETYTDFSKPSARGSYSEGFPGVVRPLLSWTATKTE